MIPSKNCEKKWIKIDTDIAKRVTFYINIAKKNITEIAIKDFTR